MRLVAAIALGVSAVAAVLTWGPDWAIVGRNDDTIDTIGAILMIGAGVVLIALIFLSESRSEGRTNESEAIDEPDDRLPARWPPR